MSLGSNSPVLIKPAPLGPEEVDGRAIIGYKSILRNSDAVITASTSTSPAVNASDDLTYDYWLPTNGGENFLNITLTKVAKVDYFAIAAHDIFSKGGMVDFQFLNSDSPEEWESMLTSGGYVPTSDAPFMLPMTEIGATQFRLRVFANQPCRVGILFAGKRLDLQRFVRVGHVPGPLNDDNRYILNESEGGQFIGRSLVRRANLSELRLSYLTPKWVRANWKPFQIHAREKPFFFLWDSQDFPKECIFGYATNSPQPALESPLYEGVSLQMRGLA